MLTLGAAAQPPSIDDVRDARRLLRGSVLETPCVRSSAFSELARCTVMLKLENRQHTGSFKVRGAGVKLATLSDAERRRGAIAASAGNHAQGVAYHGTRLGVATTIVMPDTTPFTKIRRTEALGARVVLCGRTFAEAAAHAEELARSENLVWIHPYDDPQVVAGGGTVALEMLEVDSDLDVLLVPVGGGGLLAGMAIAAKAASPKTSVIGVQTELFPSLYNALHGLSQPRGGATLAEGIAVAHIADANAAVARTHVDDVLLVDEASIEQAVHLFLEEEKLLVEGAGAAPLAALLKFAERFYNKRVGLVVSGGNIDTGLLAAVIGRVRLQKGRVTRMRVHMIDAPGALAQVATIVAQFGANILEVAHHRTFRTVPVKCAELDVTVEARRPSDIAAIVGALRNSGFDTALPDGDSADG